MRKFVQFLTSSVVIVLTSTVHAEPIVTPLDKGNVAPYSGVLLSPEAVAKIVADAHECLERTKIEIQHARDVQKAQDDKRLADETALFERDKKVADAALRQRDGQIVILSAEVARAQKAASNSWLWVSLGAIVGVLTSVAVFAVAR